MQLDIDPMGLWLPGNMPNNPYMYFMSATMFVPSKRDPTRLKQRRLMVGDLLWTPALTSHWFVLTGIRFINSVRRSQ